jgi:transposase
MISVCQDRRYRACWHYRAGPGGYDLYRLLTSMGVACEAVAPSPIPKGGSDKVKTDRRDACRQARLLRAGELTAVRVPARAEEAVRVRVRAGLVADRKRAQQRLTAALMRHGCIWCHGSYWTGAHRAWIAAQRFSESALAAAIAHYRAALDTREAEQYTAQVLGKPANLSGVVLCGLRAMRPARAVASPVFAVAAVAAVVAAGPAGCTSPSSSAGHGGGAASTRVRRPPSPCGCRLLCRSS